MGREQAQPMEDTGSGRRPNGDDLSDTSVDGPDWSKCLTGAQTEPCVSTRARPQRPIRKAPCARPYPAYEGESAAVRRVPSDTSR